MENQIKICENEAFVVGRLKEKNIKFTRDDSGRLMASGHLVISTNTKFGQGETRVSLLQYELTKNGTENSLYKGLKTIQAEYKSANETGSIETADLVKISGSLSDETYFNTKSNDFVEKVGIRGTFVNRVTREKEAEDKVNVMLEGHIADIKAVEDELEVHFISVGYGGVAIPIVGYVPKDLVIPFQNRHQVGQTTTLYFAIVNTVVVTKIEKEHGFGESLGEVIEKTVNKNIIFGGGAIDYNTPYTNEQMQQALSLREVKLNEKKEKSLKKDKSNNMTAGFGQGNNNFGMPQQNGFGMPQQGTGNQGFGMPSPNTGNPTFCIPQQNNTMPMSEGNMPY